VQRSNKQSKCMYGYCQQLADKLNDAGFSVNDGKVFKMPIRFTKENVKENMFNVVMNKMFPEIESTTELSTTQMKDVYEGLNLITSENWGVGADWPTRHNGGVC